MPTTKQKWEAAVARAETALAPWQEGMGARLTDMEKWLNKRYKPMTEQKVEEMMTSEVIIDDNWTEEDERELQEAWLTHPTRLYIVQQTKTAEGYRQIAQSCQLITRMYRCPPQKIISRDNGFRYQGRDSATMSGPFRMQLEKVALHPFFKYRVSHLVIAIG
ncbi:hypothetical protein DL546_007674 [Coniochaeta pulveracea]|uniref:Uncharacterized protein n=1 Tax=Coniochaeta pulveracea TaxID=177199 RepID=A0A420YGK2_9PEZI|nr:hypothetical protein DL546_007674 [Coniochaeta pulveracea]